MAHRNFTMTLPADSNYHGLYNLMAGLGGETPITGAVPTDGILPDRCARLYIQMLAANGASNVNISDRNSANSAGAAYAGGDAFLAESDRNTICLRDYTLKGSGLGVIVDVEYK